MRIRNTTESWSEKKHQIRLVKWCKENNVAVSHSANEGSREAKTGAILNLMGMSAGFPDLTIPQARGGYFGCYLEVKQNRKYTKSEKNKKQWMQQDAWIVYLCERGYFVHRVYGWEHGAEVLIKYLSWKETAFLPRD